MSKEIQPIQHTTDLQPTTSYTPEPWERQIDEPWRYFEYFVTFRDASPAERRLKKVAQRLSVDQFHLSTIAKKYKWRERLELWQDELAKEREEINIVSREEAQKRQKDLAFIMMEKAKEAITMLDPDDIKPADIIKMAEAAVKIDNLAHDAPTENISDKRTVNVNVNKSQNLSQQLILNPNSAEQALDVLEQLALGEVVPGCVRNLRDGRTVVISETSSNNKPETSGSGDGQNNSPAC